MATEALRLLENLDDGRQKFLVELPGYDKGLEVTAGWLKASPINVSPDSDAAATAAKLAMEMGVQVAAAIGQWLPMTFDGATTGETEDQAARIGSLIARRYYSGLKASIEAAQLEAKLAQRDDPPPNAGERQ
jgi:hypothetical protein